MKKKRKYYSEALMVVHQMMEDAYEVGAISAERMRFFDEECLVAEPEPAFSKSPGSRGKPVIPVYAKT
jgi:DNA-binding transcriptional regulator YiaG